MSSSDARPYIGGQAVIEGVMMRSPASLTIVCRRKSGELAVRERPMPPAAKGPRSWPLVRGVMTVVESLKLGSQALRWSAELYEQDLREEDAAENAKAGKPPVLSALSLAIVSLVTRADGEPAAGAAEPGAKKGVLRWLPLVFAIVLLVLLPQLVAELITWLFKLDLPVTSPAYQAITGAAKLAIVVGYLMLIRRMPEIRRVFQYHGAEHKAISTYEANEELVVAHARAKTTLHPRCGTTFLVMVALVSIVVFTMIGTALPVLPGNRVVQGIGF
ncbi:MAG TPA: DUF1385 domain-containing protein, partial [Minicystis sp.]|nr:DUF1385 domain-containing protein [Minicystis sp.]